MTVARSVSAPHRGSAWTGGGERGMLGRRMDEPHMPPGMRVLVIGRDHVVQSDKSRLMLFARALGQSLMELARPRAVLITGGRPQRGGFVDEAVVQGALDVVGDDAYDRIVTLPDPDHNPEHEAALTPTFRKTRVIGALSGARQSRRFEMVLAADAVVSIAGKRAVREMIMLARALGRPVLPLPFAGQESEKLWRKPTRDEGERFERAAAQWDSADRGSDLRRFAPAVAETVKDMASLACFVARPVSGQLSVEQTRALEAALEDASFHWVESAATPGAGRIPELMLRQIREAFVVVALLSDERYAVADRGAARSVNPNVVYEVGYADGHRRPCILLAASADDLPFDLQDMRTITYGGREPTEIRRELACHLRALRDA
jgi:hypothetical protein